MLRLVCGLLSRFGWSGCMVVVCRILYRVRWLLMLCRYRSGCRVLICRSCSCVCYVMVWLMFCFIGRVIRY